MNNPDQMTRVLYSRILPIIACGMLAGILIPYLTEYFLPMIALLVVICWAGWALGQPARILKTLFVVAPLVNPGIPWHPFNIYMSSALILVAAISTLLLIIAKPINLDALSHPIIPALILFVSINLISLLFHQGVTMEEGMRIIFLFLQTYVVAMTIRISIQTTDGAYELIPWLAVGGVLGCSAALLSFFVPEFDPWSRFSAISASSDQYGAVVRIQGSFNHANNLGIFTAYIFTLIVTLAMVRKRWATIIVPASPILIGTLALTFSRGAWLGAGIGTVSAVLFTCHVMSRRQAIQMMLVGVCLVLTVGFATALILSGRDVLRYSLLERVELLGTSSIDARFNVWGPNFDRFSEFPLIGAGPGIARYSGTESHNSYLQVLVETGMLGAGTYLLILAIVIRELWLALITASDRRDIMIAAAASSVWSASLIIGLFHTATAQVFSNWVPGALLGIVMISNATRVSQAKRTLDRTSTGFWM